MTYEETLNEIEKAGDDHLFILWTGTDIDTVNNMIFMYAENACIRKWWDKVTVIIWGGSMKLAVENEEVRRRIRKMQEEGVRFTACISCAKNMEAEGKLKEMGIDMYPWGPLLTKLIRDNKKLITL